MKIKVLFLLTFTLLLSYSSFSQRNVRIGYIDTEYILENVPEYQQATSQLDEKVKQWQSDIEKRLNEVEQKKIQLSNESVLLTKELIEEREEEIQIEEQEILDYQQKRFGPNGDLMIQKKQLMQPVQDQIFAAVQEIAANRKYDFIFDKSADIVMLFAAQRNDVSDIVLRSINRAAKRKEVRTKKDKKEVEKRDDLSLEEDKEVTEREIAIEEKKDERQKLMEERKRVRDSVRAVKKAEFDAKRQRLLEERQRRKDSIINARKPKNDTPEEEDEGGL